MDLYLKDDLVKWFNLLNIYLSRDFTIDQPYKMVACLKISILEFKCLFEIHDAILRRGVKMYLIWLFQCTLKPLIQYNKKKKNCPFSNHSNLRWNDSTFLESAKILVRFQSCDHWYIQIWFTCLLEKKCNLHVKRAYWKYYSSNIYT